MLTQKNKCHIVTIKQNKKEVMIKTTQKDLFRDGEGVVLSIHFKIIFVF